MGVDDLEKCDEETYETIRTVVDYPKYRKDVMIPRKVYVVKVEDKTKDGDSFITMQQFDNKDDAFKFKKSTLAENPNYSGIVTVKTIKEPLTKYI
jgi:hypothetical protein